MGETVTPHEIIDFWFSNPVRRLWFESTPEFDRQVHERFLATFEAASAGRLDAWQESPAGALALVIVLDQFPLNMFRGDARSFSTEARARHVAAAAIERGFDEPLDAEHKAFLYLPFMHSESTADQKRSVELFEAAGLKDSLKWAYHHRDIIARFGRFPHRNAILGRESTPEEITYLASDEAFHG